MSFSSYKDNLFWHFHVYQLHRVLMVTRKKFLEYRKMFYYSGTWSKNHINRTNSFTQIHWNSYKRQFETLHTLYNLVLILKCVLQHSVLYWNALFMLINIEIATLTIWSKNYAEASVMVVEVPPYQISHARYARNSHLNIMENQFVKELLLLHLDELISFKMNVLEKLLRKY